jgi:diguanylate cyclase (GGDEF)-like protein/PAS domain S-box-containing protein
MTIEHGMVASQSDAPTSIFKPQSLGGHSARYFHWLSLLSIMVGVVLSVIGFKTLVANERFATRTSFEQASVARARAIHSEVTQHMTVLTALGAFYDSSQAVSRDEFHEFSQNFLTRAPGVQALEWAPRIRSGERDAFERSVRSAFPQFQLTERKEQEMVRAQQRDEHFPVLFIEPNAGNEKALGFDLNSEPVRAAALGRALDSGEMVASQRIKLVQENSLQFGVLLLLPIFQHKAAIGTVEQRRAHVRGFVLAVMRPGNFLDKAISGLPLGGVDILLSDASAPLAEQFLYFYPSRSRAAGRASADVVPAARADFPPYVETVYFGGRRWLLSFTPAPGHYGLAPSWAAWGFLLAGLVFFALVGGNLQLMRRRVLVAGAANSALRLSEARYKSLIEISSDAYWEQDENMVFSPAFVESLSTDAQRATYVDGKARWDLPDSMPLQGSWADHQAVLAAHLPFRDFEFRYRSYDGEIHYASISGAPLFGTDGGFKGYHGLSRDITTRIVDDQKVRDSEASLATAQHLTQVGSWEIDLDNPDNFKNSRAHWSDEVFRILGHEPGEIEASMTTFINAVHPADRALFNVPVSEQAATGMNNRVEHRIIRPDGSERIVQEIGKLVIDPVTHQPVKFIGTMQDITERKHAEQKLAYLAQFDTLTGLPNRHMFYDQLTQTLARAEGTGGLMACMFVDLDRFKYVNDTYGHGMGDNLLVQVAERLRQCLRSGDIVGRIGGDEFAVLLAHLARPEDAGVVAEKMVRALSARYPLDDHEVHISASIGIAVYPGDGGDADEVLGNADTAMYRAKEQGRNNYQFYLPEMNERLARRQQLETSLRGALERHEFLLYYQPKVELGGGAVSGFEALLRWRHPQRGIVSPIEFIPVLEDTGQIVPVGEWVLRTVCAQIKAWQAEGLAPMSVAINLSGRQFQKEPLDAFIACIVESGIDPALIKLELTESLLMKAVAETEQSLVMLKASGVRLSMDDFGTGYSSLAYLKRFPLDELKIDRAFISDVTTNPEDAEITLTIIRLAHILNLRVVAEGVETEAQLNFLRAHGCDEIQGYYFSRPLNVEDCTRLLREGRRLQMPIIDDSLKDVPTVLIVDDDPLDLKLMQRALEPGGYRILLADNPREAFEVLTQRRVSIIIGDHIMPGMSGVKFLAQVRRLYPDAIRIVLSGVGDFRTVTDAVNEAGIHKYLSKDWDAARLRSEVREAYLRHHRMGFQPREPNHAP